MDYLLLIEVKDVIVMAVGGNKNMNYKAIKGFGQTPI